MEFCSETSRLSFATAREGRRTASEVERSARREEGRSRIAWLTVELFQERGAPGWCLGELSGAENELEEAEVMT